MKTIVAIIGLFSAGWAAAQLPLQLPSLTTKDGKQYTEVVVTEKLVDGIKIMHSVGAARIKIEQLPDDVIAKLGGFDQKAVQDYRDSLDPRKAAAKRAEAKVAATQKEIEDTLLPLSLRIQLLELQQRRDPNEQRVKELADMRDAMSRLHRDCSDGRIRRSIIRNWAFAVADHDAALSMPESLVILSLGQPARKTTRPNGEEIWHFEDPRWTGSVFLENGFVTTWSITKDSKEAK